MQSETAEISRANGENSNGEPNVNSGVKSVFNRKQRTRAEAHETKQHHDLEHGDKRREAKNQSDGTSVQGTRHIQADGESGRAWFHPWQFFRVCWRSSSKVSMISNLLWPFTIAAFALHFIKNEEGEVAHPMWSFITAYIGMVPAANLLGFAGQELARKLPKVIGVILETTFGSIVEIILFMVLISGGDRNVPVIRSAILGSLLANLLLCLGMHTVVTVACDKFDN